MLGRRRRATPRDSPWARGFASPHREEEFVVLAAAEEEAFSGSTPARRQAAAKPRGRGIAVGRRSGPPRPRPSQRWPRSGTSPSDTSMQAPTVFALARETLPAEGEARCRCARSTRPRARSRALRPSGPGDEDVDHRPVPHRARSARPRGTCPCTVRCSSSERDRATFPPTRGQSVAAGSTGDEPPHDATSSGRHVGPRRCGQREDEAERGRRPSRPGPLSAAAIARRPATSGRSVGQVEKCTPSTKASALTTTSWPFRGRSTAASSPMPSDDVPARRPAPGTRSAASASMRAIRPNSPRSRSCTSGVYPALSAAGGFGT